MNLDEFERRLRAEPFRSVPPEWREELLPRPNRAAVSATTLPFATPACRWLSDWFWPSPAAWGALAACWVAILILNGAARPSAAELAEVQANARLAVAYQALIRDFGVLESGVNAGSAPPANRLPQRPNQSQARPNSSAKPPGWHPPSTMP